MQEKQDLVWDTGIKKIKLGVIMHFQVQSSFDFQKMLLYCDIFEFFLVYYFVVLIIIYLKNAWLYPKSSS